MSDRIKLLKSEARRMPKNPAAAGNGPRRISVGTIGVRKVRRASVKSNTSSGSGSRRRNPFADLVPSQTKTSTLQPRKIIVKPTMTKGSQHQPVLIMNKKVTGKVPSRPLVVSSPRIPSAKGPPKSPVIEKTAFEPTLEYRDPFKEVTPVENTKQVTPVIAPEAQELSTTALPDTNQPNSRARPSLVHGFVQEDDEKAMESMAMDKIDRFLESLGGTPTNTRSPVHELSSPVLAASAFPSVDTSRPATNPATALTSDVVPTQCETPFLPMKGPSSVTSWTTDPEIEEKHEQADMMDDEASITNTSISARVVPPLSIKKSPSATNSQSLQPPTPDATNGSEEEMFRGVKVSWLLETYHDYMAEKAQTEAALPDKTSPTSSSSSKGLRPLILPAVCKSPTTKIESPVLNSTTADDKPLSPPKLRRTPTKLNFTFGSPRISPEGALKSPTIIPSSPSARTRPVSMPIMKRSNTGLSQQDAVEVARLKMNNIVAAGENYLAPHIMQATTVWRPSLNRNDTVGSQYSALLPPLQHFEPEQVKLASPTSVDDSYAKKTEITPEEGYFANMTKLTSPAMTPGELRRMSERKRIVTNNISFYDPFGGSPPQRTSPPTHFSHNRAKTEDARLAASISNKIEKQVSPSLEVKRVISGEPQLHVARTELVGALSATSVPAQRPNSHPSETMSVRRLSRPSKEYAGESTSEDDDLLPKIRPRFEGFGTSSKAQKLLGMTDSEVAGKKPDIKKKKSLNSSTKKTTKAKTIEAPVLDRNKSKGARRPSSLTQKSSTSVTGSRQLVEPFYEDKDTLDLFSRKSEHPAEFGSATIYPPTKAPSPSATAAQRSSYFSGETGIGSTSTNPNTARNAPERPSITEQYVNLVDRQASSVIKGRPVPLSRVSSRYDETGPKMPSPLSREFGSSDRISPTRTVHDIQNPNSPTRVDFSQRSASKTKLTYKSVSPNGSPGDKIDLSRAVTSEPEPHKMFGNYRLSQSISPINERAYNVPVDTSPNSDGHRSADREGFQGDFMGEALYCPNPDESGDSPGRARKSSHNAGTGQNGVQVLAPKATRKTSRGLQGRLSVIEQSPLLGSDSSFGKHHITNTSPTTARSRPEPSVHGLGLGMSPSPSNAFDQILGSDRHSVSPRPGPARISTLDRINKSADPHSPRTHSSTSGHSDRPDRSVTSYAASRTSHADTTRDSAVPISYYQPREHKQNADPFRNLDMKTVTKPTSSGPSGLRRKTPPSNTFSSASSSNVTNRYSDPTGFYKELGHGKSISPVESIGSGDRHYVARPSDTNTYQKSASGRAVHTKSSKIGVMTPRKIEPPASMMAASEVHERFDIRRALARSDAGDDEEQYGSARQGGRGRAGSDEADTFGALANTATQAFSKWFG